MANIDLITVVHPEDKREPKFKYTFKAPANSGIKSGDYVIADIKGKETLGSVVSVLENVDEESNLMNYIRTVSTIKNQKLKPISYKLVKVALVDESIEKQQENNSEFSNNIPLGTVYYSIEQGVNSVGISREHYLYPAEYTYCDCEADANRIESGNMFFDEDEVKKIVEVIMGNIIDKSKFIEIKKELKKIM